MSFCAGKTLNVSFIVSDYSRHRISNDSLSFQQFFYRFFFCKTNVIFFSLYFVISLKLISLFSFFFSLSLSNYICEYSIRHLSFNNWYWSLKLYWYYNYPWVLLATKFSSNHTLLFLIVRTSMLSFFNLSSLKLNNNNNFVSRNTSTLLKSFEW